ncbi:outer membrane porin [Herbaspirillum sp. GW103]|jgi:predicted porin|uniref:porin n=1 Tax=unclassified Herbaspirillum TaxID=2624150 RepID=UPI00025E392E|nr:MULTISPECIES: porin [unclassified Herbaspirillum]EIJ45364.1 outer membrane porin [Herbaspirillum sp. GW103]MCI1004242.1 porin [Herbaspirillum sp. C7C8]
MKKSLLALAVLGAFAGAAQAQSSVTIYGIVDTGLAYTSKAVNTAGTGSTGSKFGVNSGVIQGSRIGFKGVEDLGGGLSALFQLETGFNNDNGALNGQDGTTGTTNLFRRKSIVGLSGGFGSVTLGRQTDFADTISAYTSVNDFGSVVGAVGHNLDRLEGTRTNNSIAYTTANLSGFTGNLIYGFGETAGKTTAGQSFGIGGKYDNGPLGLGVTYYQSKQGATPSDTALLSTASATQAGNSALKALNVVASYQFGPARVYGNYSRVKQDLNTTSPTALASKTLGVANKADIYELGTAYSLSPSLKLLGAVTHTRADFNSSSKGKLTQVSLGADYWLSKRTDLYAFVANIHAKDMANTGVFGDATGTATIGSADNSQTAVAVGIRHKF